MDGQASFKLWVWFDIASSQEKVTVAPLIFHEQLA